MTLTNHTKATAALLEELTAIQSRLSDLVDKAEDDMTEEALSAGLGCILGASHIIAGVVARSIVRGSRDV